jgi:hypothetical protein
MLGQDYIYFQVENGGRPKWREALATVRSEMQPGDLVVAAAPRMSEYYLPELEAVFVKPVMERPEAFDREWREKGVRVWFVLDAGNFNVIDPNQKFQQWVRQRTRLVKTLPVFARAMDRTIHVYIGSWAE